MELEYAKKLLETLSDGINPMTGEILPETDSANQVQIVRALHTVLDEINKKSIKTSKTHPENAGKPWTAQDDAMLCRMFENGCSREEISKQFKRSHSGIAARLVRLGKITNREEYGLRSR